MNEGEREKERKRERERDRERENALLTAEWFLINLPFIIVFWKFC